VNAWLLAAVPLGSGLVSAVMVRASIVLANRAGQLDRPDQPRKTQATPVPRLGGLAMAVAFTLAAVGVLALSGRSDQIGLAWVVLAPALAAALLGFADDQRHLSPWLRLALQAGVGALAWLLGMRIALAEAPWVDAPLTALWFALVINAVNLLDNSDGVAAGVTLIGAAGAAVIAAVNGQALVLPLALALVGVAAGYLVWNWYPARTYMGDAGAYFLGALLAALTIALRPASSPPAVGVLVAVLLVAVPLADMAHVVLKRVHRGVHPFTAGRDHAAHVIEANGRSPRAAAGLLLTAASISAIAAIGLTILTRGSP